MARNTCPSCGSPYNGKKCRNCLYEAYPDEIVRNVHAPKGTPLVTDVPSGRKQSPVKEKTPRRRNPLARFVLLLTLIYSVMPMLRSWGLDLKARERESSIRQVAVQPEPVVAAEDMVILCQQSEITIFVSAEDLSDFRDGLCLYVQNDSSLNVTVSAGDITVDGCPMPHSRLVCRAGANAIGKGWLELDPEDLKKSGIQEYRTVSFDLTALQNSRILFDTGEILITAEGAETYG